MTAAMSEPLQRLAQALDVERQALVEHDVHALIRATGAKLEALRALEGAPPVGEGEQLQNWPNATGPTVCCCRAAGARSTGRCASWAVPNASAYDAKGQSHTVTARRPRRRLTRRRSHYPPAG
jgi:hypothetical protein